MTVITPFLKKEVYNISWSAIMIHGYYNPITREG